MKSQTDKSATTRWNNFNISYKNYQNYIVSKGENRLNLTLMDLFYVSNFKGGNASIHEEEEEVNKKLISYADMLKKINRRFGERRLRDLSDGECKKLISLIMDACALISKTETKIYGIGTSYLSALLNAYFPNLIPILDRRLLINMKLVSNDDLVPSTRQIRRIEDFYPSLVEKFRELSNVSGDKTLRDIDREYFVRELDYGSLEIKNQ